MEPRTEAGKRLLDRVAPPVIGADPEEEWVANEWAHRNDMEAAILAIEEEARTVNPEGRSTDEDGLRAALHAAIDECDEVGWDESRTTDLRPEAVHAAIDGVFRSALTTSSPGDEIGAAWAEAEAALPEGLTFTLTRAVRPAAEEKEPTYYATARRPWTEEGIAFQVTGPTPAAALRSLADRLRSTPSSSPRTPTDG